MQVRLKQPQGCVKILKEESIEVHVLIENDSHDQKEQLQDENIIVETWIKGEKTHSHSLQKNKDNTYVGSLTFPETGHYTITFRSRSHTHNYWQWSCDTLHVWVDPSWIQDAIVYNAFIRLYGAKEIDSSGKLKKITPGTFGDVKAHMSKLKKMGINVLYLNPVYPIGELYKNVNPHDILPGYLQPGCPYSIKDYTSIDPELSLDGRSLSSSDHPLNDFRNFVKEAHKQGIRVFMDLVFNHSAHDSVFQRLHPEWFLYKENITSLSDPYLYPEDIKNNKPWGDAKHTFSPNDHGYWWKDAAQLNWNNIESYPDFIMKDEAPNKPPRNPTIDEMHEYFINVVKYWIREFGIDGFRCDVAYRVPADFWKKCIIESRIEAKKQYPKNGSLDGDVIFIAEDYHVSMKELFEAGFFACYGDYSNKLGSVSDSQGYLDYMYNRSGNFFPNGSKWFIFPECHDFHRAPEKLVGTLREQHKDADLNANKSRWTLTACLPGLPMLFNGFEKIEWAPVNLFSYSTIDWESDKDISEHISVVNKIRRKELSLQKGSYIPLQTNNQNLFAFLRTYKKETLLIVVNFDIVQKSTGEVYLTNDFAQKYSLKDLLSKKNFSREGTLLYVELEAGDSHIFKVQKK